MSNAERRLAEAFAADMPPATDHAFTFAVLERIERRRAWTDVFESVPFIIAAVALFWLLAPTFDRLMQEGTAVFNTPAFFATIALLLTLFVLFNPFGRATFEV